MRWDAIVDLSVGFVKDAAGDDEGFIGFFEGIASTPDVDLEGDRFAPEVLERSVDQLRGKPILILHGRGGEAAVGEILDAEYSREEGLRIKAGIYKRFKPIWEMIKQGALKALSIGGVVKQYRIVDGVREILEAEINEVSLTPRGVNPSAKIVSFFGKSYEINEMGFLDKIEKATPPPHETKKAPEDMPWDAEEAVERLRRWASRDGTGRREAIDWEKYKLGFAWYDEKNKQSFSSYKLPHHTIIDNELTVVWRGVVAAMAALAGARGGVEIPEEDKPSVYQHLATHYKQFNRQPPPYETLKTIQKTWPHIKELVETQPKALVTNNEAVKKTPATELDTPILKRIHDLIRKKNKETASI